MVCVLNCLFETLRNAGHITGSGGDITFSPTLRYGGSVVVTILCIGIYFMSGLLFNTFFKSYRYDFYS